MLLILEARERELERVLQLLFERGVIADGAPRSALPGAGMAPAFASSGFGQESFFWLLTGRRASVLIRLIECAKGLPPLS